MGAIKLYANAIVKITYILCTSMRYGNACHSKWNQSNNVCNAFRGHPDRMIFNPLLYHYWIFRIRVFGVPQLISSFEY